MSKLERWLPFKFRRRKKGSEEGSARVALERRSARPETAVWPFAPSPFFSSPMQALMRSFFDDPFFGDPIEPFGPFRGLDRWFGDFSPSYFLPPVEVSEEPDALKVTAELPGLDREDLRLEIEGDTLVIRGEKRAEEESEESGVFRTERYYGSFRRVIPLPDDLDLENTEATFRNGVLTIRLPKEASARERSREIPIAA